MKEVNRKLWQAAEQIREGLLAVKAADLAALQQQTSCVTSSLARFNSLQQKLTKCQNRQFLGAARRLRGQGDRLLGDLRFEIDSAQRRFEARPFEIPSMAELTRELEQLGHEFEQWEYDKGHKTLSVVTGPIELDGLYLGPFRIKLYVHDLREVRHGQPYSITALDPHPAVGADHVTHPHVSDDRLCAGDASASITSSLLSGRICDFCLIVQMVLNTYNPESPYVKLEEWEGEACSDCGYTISDNSRYWCEECEQNYCQECISGCWCCDTSICCECLTSCPVCEESVCTGCLTKCSECGEPYCVSCLEEEMCPSCIEAKENDNEEESQKEAVSSTADPSQAA